MSLPPDLTDDDIHAIFESLDVYLNTTILQALTHRLYTGILIVTFWSIFRSTKNSTVGRCIMVLAISSLYVLASVALGEVWAFTHHAFIDEGQNCYTVYSELNGFSPMSTQATLAAGITSCISTVIADSSLIWRCWILWGRRWLVVIIPILCTILGTVLKAIESYTLASKALMIFRL
ncbi:uncharacterized protein BT62DRAFT_996787 [Guyanagaster necrorhizus]|uniref:Uncharacterized protein n=1 Tax=Guyanagaster necrorhizus TaxID=856835 RepID=A0A9P7VKI8_9AGAR|nr:uncharacterized protein BT62DRAFT_996787 [Guyanagaster necrorhizus MCA 3950]KAG7442240.1 hypothetical protein BT62DRAFT_996787 [Guyanagaster necrorhizus MCA 3950]